MTLSYKETLVTQLHLVDQKILTRTLSYGKLFYFFRLVIFQTVSLAEILSSTRRDFSLLPMILSIKATSNGALINWKTVPDAKEFIIYRIR